MRMYVHVACACMCTHGDETRTRIRRAPRARRIRSPRGTEHALGSTEGYGARARQHREVRNTWRAAPWASDHAREAGAGIRAALLRGAGGLKLGGRAETARGGADAQVLQHEDGERAELSSISGQHLGERLARGARSSSPSYPCNAWSSPSPPRWQSSRAAFKGGRLGSVHGLCALGSKGRCRSGG